MIILLIAGISTMKAQEGVKKAVNPYPISKVKIQEILNRNEKIIGFYTAKFKNKTLDQWPKEARDSFLIAKAKKINIMFVPDYYRDYNMTPSISKTNAPADHRIYPNGLLYTITFYVNPLKEKLISDALIEVSIWSNGKAEGFIVPVHENSGDFFTPPLWEEGKYQEWQKNNFHRFSYRTGYENMPTKTLDEIFKEKQKEAQKAKR